MKSFRKYVAIPIFLTILLFGVVIFFVVKKAEGDSNSAWTEFLNGAKYSLPTDVETDENGVYTNYQYGFKFEYPQSIFTTSNPWDGNGKSFFIDNNTSPLFRIIKLNPDWLQRYEACKNAKKGEIISQTAKSGTQVKLYSVDNRCVVASDPRGLQDGEPSWSYTGYFVQDQEIFALSLSARDETTIRPLRATFDDIVSSFKFIASINK